MLFLENETIIKQKLFTYDKVIEEQDKICSNNLTMTDGIEITIKILPNISNFSLVPFVDNKIPEEFGITVNSNGTLVLTVVGITEPKEIRLVGNFVVTEKEKKVGELSGLIEEDYIISNTVKVISEMQKEILE